MKNKLVIIVVKSLRALESILARLKCKSQDIFWWRPGAVSPVCTPRHCHAASSLPIVHTNSKSILLLCKHKMLCCFSLMINPYFKNCIKFWMSFDLKALCQSNKQKISLAVLKLEGIVLC